MRSRKAGDFAAAKATIDSVMDTRAQQEAQKAVLAAAKGASVDPAFGKISADQSGFPSVVVNELIDPAAQEAEKAAAAAAQG